MLEVSVRWRKVLRDVWLHKARTMLVVLAIAVGIIGAGSVLNTWWLVRQATTEGYLATNPASATLRVDSVDAALLAAVRAMPALAGAEARRALVARVQSGGTWRTAVLYASNDPSAARIGIVAREEGTWPPRDGAFTLERSSQQFAQLAMGDTVQLQVGDGAVVALPVAGIARDGSLAPGWMDHVVYGFVTPATMARLGVPASLDRLQIGVRDRSMNRDAVRHVANDVAALARGMGHTVGEIDVPVPGRHMHAAQMDSLLFTQGAFGLLALLLSGFLVVNLVTAMLTGQVREIGVMKSIGASPRQLATMYLGLALLLGLAACAIALPVAAVIGRAYAGFTASLLNFDVAAYAIPARSYLLQLLVGGLLPVVAAAVPVVRGSRISVSAALRDGGFDSTAAAPAFLRHVSGVARPFLLSLRNAFRHRTRMALTLVTLSTGGAVFLGARNLRASIRDSVGLIYDSQFRFDLSVRLSAPHAADSAVAAAMAVSGVQAAEAWGGGRAALRDDDGALHPSFPVVALRPDSKLVSFPVLQGRWLRDDDVNGLVVNKRVLDEEPSVAVGKTTRLVIAGVEREWLILGVVESGPTPSAYAAPAAMTPTGDAARATSIVVRTEARGTAAQSELLQRLRESLGSSGFDVESAQLLEANRRVVEDHLLMVAGFLGIMAQLMIVVGGLGLASTMGLAVLERTREIGVLRAIGASNGAIHLLVQGEGLVIAVVSWLIAIPLSLPMSVILGQAFGRIMFPVPVTFVPEWQGVALWFGVATVTSLIACAWPARRATRITTAAALAYE